MSDTDIYTSIKTLKDKRFEAITKDDVIKAYDSAQRIIMSSKDHGF